MGIIFLPAAEYNIKQLYFMIRENYAYVILTPHGYHSNCFYYVGSSMSLFSDEGRRLQAEVLMQSNDSGYNEYSFRRYTRRLSSYEIAISRNLAMRNRLILGDFVVVSYPAFPEDVRFVIADIFSDAFGIIRPHSSGGVAIIGNNQIVAENTPLFISFVGDDVMMGNDFIFFIQNQGIIDISEMIRDLSMSIFTGFAIPILIMCIIQLIICSFFILGNSASYYHRLLLFGRCLMSIKNEIRIDCIVVSLPIALATLVANLVTIRIALGYSFSHSALLLILLQCLTVIVSYRIILKKIAPKKRGYNLVKKP